MMNLCTPYVLQRVYDSELKSNADDKFTSAELIHRVRDTIWSEIEKADSQQKYTDAKPMISSIRRNLQRQHLAYMLASAGGSRFSPMSPDLQGMVRFSLQELGDKISEVLNRAKPDGELQLDFATRAHLTECRDMIDKALDVQHVKRTDS